jgi:hypothetical protein
MSSSPLLQPPLPPRLVGLAAAVRRRVAAIRVAFALPLFVFAALLLPPQVGGRSDGVALVISIAIAMMLLLGVLFVWQGMRRYDAVWLLRRLNAEAPQFEDSALLLLPPTAASAGLAAPMGSVAPTGLAALQRLRLERRLPSIELPDLRPRYPLRALCLTWLALAVALLVVSFLPQVLSQWRQVVGAREAAPMAPGAVSGSLRIEPPAYTRLAVQEPASLEAKFAEGSVLHFAVRIGGNPQRVDLVFLDGSRLPLRRDGEVWRGERVFTSSALYRVQLDGRETPASAPSQQPSPASTSAERLYRLDVIPDHPPDVIVRTPDHTLSVLQKGQKSWDLVFEASDDYGLGLAELSVAHAQGSGDNIKTTQQTRRLAGDGDERHRVYHETLDLAALGVAEGDDLIVRLRVADNHPAPPNVTQTASFILRWPAQVETASSGMDGLAQKTLPAYFSSERQIIIDTEALQGDRERLSTARFASRADELGVEQRQLRLRYGEFLGEEAEPSAQHDADTQPTTQAFGAEGNLSAQYGHVHDKPEAATLLDPDTRRILKSALDEMWQAELHLRQADPQLALPYEYKALAYIKQVQQAERIYLARAGVQLPQVDPTRRLSGDRAGLVDRTVGAVAQTPEPTPVAAFWQALSDETTPDWAALNAWVRAHQATLPDALGLESAADRLQRDPSCRGCRAQLAALLWALLPPPAPAIQPRSAPDRGGQAYLDALSETPP